MRNVKTLLTAALSVWSLVLGARTDGWTGENADRKELPPQKVLWRADLAQAKLELRDGAEGTMRVITDAGQPKLELVKKNGSGMMIVTMPPFEVKPGAKLRVSAQCAARDGDPEEGEAYLRLYGKKEDLSYFKGLDGRGPGGPRMEKMVNSPEGMSVRKLAHRLADKATGTSITAAIVVAGPASMSVWSDWLVEDKNASDRAWAKYRKSLEPKVVEFGSVSDADLDRALAVERDHTAELRTVDGWTRLFVDGFETAPVIFKGQYQKMGRITYAGGLHKDLALQCISVRFGRDAKNPHGIWTKDGFDAKAGAAVVRNTMRLAPEAKFILQVSLNAYPEWTEEHPDEIWRLADGRRVYGSNTHASFEQKLEMPAGSWYWPSYHSLVWREEVKRHLAELVGELKRQGLAKRIVGVHLAGYHDAQFATRHPDFSAPAVAAFRDWQKMSLGEIRWQEAPVFGSEWHFDPQKDAHQIAYLKFIKQGPFHMQEDLARHVKVAFGKPIIVGRYCMGWDAGAFNSALDIAPFLRSDAVDFLVAQPNYSHRVPGVAIGSRLPTASFHAHGKLFVNEFDLRTYGGVAGSESELRVLGLSQATDFPMWETIHRKLAGQMLAQRMGWWYLDMSGRWFSPPEIVRDIAQVHSQVLAAESAPKEWIGWHPSAALAIDEDGMLLCNTIGHYYHSAESNVKNQIRALFGSGVPIDLLEVGDLLENASLAKRYRVVLFSGMHDRDAARRNLLERLGKAGVKSVFLSAEKPLKPSAFAEIVRKAGGYVPTAPGLEVDMNDTFISVHALKTGRYDFTLPRACAAYNMKTGRREANGATLKLDLVVGETAWFSLGPLVVEPQNVPPLATADWKARRETVRQTFAREVFGERPVERPANLRFETLPDRTIMNGAAVHRQVKIACDGPRAPFAFTANAYLPKGARNIKSFVYIHLGQRIRNEGFVASSDWPEATSFPVGDIIRRGYGAVSFDNWEVAMDDKTACFTTGVFRAWGPASDAARGEHEWGAVSAWAWGASRVLDWIGTQPDFDARHVAVIGHSRGGKTALWAAATDERFALACVNDSGCGGAKLNHMDLSGSETIGKFTKNFPHWYAKRYRTYIGHDRDLPFDQHELVALVAPRSVAIGSATRDDWAGPAGEFASAAFASPAWVASGLTGLVAPDGMPAPDTALGGGCVGYHIRSGKHDLTRADWKAYLDFADRRMR